MAMSSPSQTSYKRPNLGEMTEAPDMKKVHALPSHSMDWAHWDQKQASTSSNTVEHEAYEKPSAPTVIQGMEWQGIDETSNN